MSSIETDPTELQRARPSSNGQHQARSVYDRIGGIERGIVDLREAMSAAALQRAETAAALREMRGAILSALGAAVLVFVVGFLLTGVAFFVR